MQTPIHFSGLNGIRAIAALSVVILHTTTTLKKFNLNPHIFGTYSTGEPKGFLLGTFGVSMFFVLSGFLITYLLQTEKEASHINIRKFYARRILRIWPLYFLYLAAAVSVALYTGVEPNTKTLLLYIFFAANVPYIFSTPLPFLAHYWSLGSEEQFYLVWPWINKLFKKLIVPVVLLIIVIMGIKIVIHITQPHSIYERAVTFTRYHGMLIGALGAILYKNNNVTFLKIVDNKLTQGICWLLILFAAVNQFNIAWYIDDELISVATLFIIIGQIGISNRLINLETKTMNFLGKISYGIYVIHPLLIIFLSVAMKRVELSVPVKLVLIFTIIPLATILGAWISYNFFEKYFLNLKKKFEVVKSRPS
ncbi:MAG: acyltransferase [Bacteroidetes bacterium]|jgi:peptidoglycan/LPS O-acetylase OafA/YrhL|nr:acyltransferase [Bacteroidota bacterium]